MNLFVTGGARCTGALISRKNVLTAAHCNSGEAETFFHANSFVENMKNIILSQKSLQTRKYLNIRKMNANCQLTRIRIRVFILWLSETAWSAQARRFCKLKATFFVPAIKNPFVTRPGPRTTPSWTRSRSSSATTGARAPSRTGRSSRMSSTWTTG